MAERESLGRASVNYEGIFNVKELIKTIQDAGKDKKFSFKEMEHTESLTPEGKFVELKADIDKKITDYAKGIVKFEMQVSKMQEKLVEQDGKRKKYHTGKIIINLEAWLVTDYEKRWEMKPTMYLLRVFFEKYVFGPHLDKDKKETTATMEYIKSNIKNYFNLMKYES